ncbi:PD-(D/E)XK nuclease-like domain-containing protein [Oceanobacillus alkalisoli]|uniref:PD-(D/E)XK nuclease-like domain-containing protein n=1 Tax=Oceanobacillus alkalisoli TaxID=2925113 RepID=UPI001EE4042E|nr:PD-(D/E)XK nuclease-like domain-containing protein [Oceanobacillus alkalisoli]MCG5104408.1 PD-(D/E)XK nuclease-like domain-containing protein [Oceanobacillus alkalisoli]
MQETKPKLNSSNYYSLEMDRQYMSVSQLKNWNECEASAMAYLSGEIRKEPNAAMLVGSYTHAAFESEQAFSDFIEENNSVIFKKNKSKYADYEQADLMIETLRNDPFAMFAMEGEKEQIYTANAFGIDWKMKVDSINHERMLFTDLKTTRNLFERSWSEKYDGWVSFVERWDYVLQMAMYRKIIEVNTGELYTPYIVAVSKEKIPNKAVIYFDESRFDFEYEWVQMKLERINEVRSGEVGPVRCEKCDYCKSTKKLSAPIEVGELIYV